MQTRQTFTSIHKHDNCLLFTGYRRDAAIHKAALNEAAAAGLLLTAGWHNKCGDEGEPPAGSVLLLLRSAAV